jgi:hypothetical protein
MSDAKDKGYHLAFAATLRLLVTEMARSQTADPPADWFLAFSQKALDYVDTTSNPSLSDQEMREAKEAAYDTLRMIFDHRGLKF